MARREKEFMCSEIRFADDPDGQRPVEILSQELPDVDKLTYEQVRRRIGSKLPTVRQNYIAYRLLMVTNRMPNENLHLYFQKYLLSRAKAPIPLPRCVSLILLGKYPYFYAKLGMFLPSDVQTCIAWPSPPLVFGSRSQQVHARPSDNHVQLLMNPSCATARSQCALLFLDNIPSPIVANNHLSC